MTAKYYHKILLPYLDDLIRTNVIKKPYGYCIDIHDLSESDLQSFAAHLIQVDMESGDLWDWLYEQADKSVLSMFSKYMLTYDQDTLHQFMNSLSKSAINYYFYRMKELIEERLPWVQHEDYYDMGLTPFIDQNNGELLYQMR